MAQASCAISVPLPRKLPLLDARGDLCPDLEVDLDLDLDVDLN
jgi:hypothetical protein